METASQTTPMSGQRALPPVLGRLLTGTFWLALRVPLQFVFALLTTRFILEAIGPIGNGAYAFAWGFGFFQFLQFAEGEGYVARHGIWLLVV